MKAKLNLFHFRRLYAAGFVVGLSFQWPSAAADSFTDANWTSLGKGLSGTVFAVAVSGTNVYAGGQFTNAGGIVASNIARWNGTSWSALGSGINGEVLALAVLGTDLCAGGQFTTAGGNPATNLARWDGSSWSALGSGTDKDGEVYALAVSGTNLYAAGYFSTMGGSPVGNIAKWDGSSWSPLGSGFGFPLMDRRVSGSNVYGAFPNN